MERYLNKFYDFIDKIGKHNFILIIFIFIVFLTTSLYQTFSLYTESEGLSILDGKDTYSFILDASNVTNSVTIASGASKNIDITVRNDSDVPLKYGLYSSEESNADTNFIFGYSTVTKHLPNGVIPAKTNYVVTLKVYNYTDENKTINFGVQYGFANDAELILDSEQYGIGPLYLMKKLFNIDTDTTYFASYRPNITEVSFVDLDTYVKESTENVIASWNVSAASVNDDSVKAWITEDNNAKNKLYIGAKDKIYVEDLQSFFARMTALTSIDFTNLDTSLTKGMERLFKGCTLLSNIDVSSFDTSNVTSMLGMFYECSSLVNLDLSSFNTSKVTNMTNIFGYCSSLVSEDDLDTSVVETGLVLGELFNTSNVTKIGGMFGYCSKLSNNLNNIIANFDTSNVTSMESMFYNCSSLTSLDLSHFDTSNVTSFSSMFLGCSGLVNLNISNFNTSKAISMSYMFAGYKDENNNIYPMILDSLDLSHFDTKNVEYMTGMFRYCRSLTTLNLNSFDTSKVVHMQHMFFDCSSLTSLDLSNFNTSNVTNMSHMFNGCSSLTTLQLSSNFKGTNVTSTGYMFNGCSNLTSLDLSNFNTPVLTEAGAMFNGCTNLTTLDISSIDTTNVTNFTLMFGGCTNLTTYIIIKSNSSITPTCTNVFHQAATASGSQILVYYTDDTKTLVNDMVGGSDEDNIYAVTWLSKMDSGSYVEYVGDKEWRIGYTKDGSVHLISAGTKGKLCTYTDSDGNVVSSSSSSCPSDSYLDADNLYKHFNNLNSIALTYCNTTYAKGGACNNTTAWAMNAEDFKNITGSPLSSTSCYQTSSTACGADNTLINIDEIYWYATATDQVDKRHGAFVWDPSNDYVTIFNSSGLYGVRPVLALDSLVAVKGGSGTYDDPYTIIN